MNSFYEKVVSIHWPNVYGSTHPPSTKKLEAMEQKGGCLIWDPWNNGTDSVHEMRVMNIYAKFHSAKTTEKCLQEADKEKKRMNLEACLQQI